MIAAGTRAARSDATHWHHNYCPAASALHCLLSHVEHRLRLCRAPACWPVQGQVGQAGASWHDAPRVEGEQVGEVTDSRRVDVDGVTDLCTWRSSRGVLCSGLMVDGPGQARYGRHAQQHCSLACHSARTGRASQVAQMRRMCAHSICIWSGSTSVPRAQARRHARTRCITTPAMLDAHTAPAAASGPPTCMLLQGSCSCQMSLSQACRWG
jgi:hypothetical protein